MSKYAFLFIYALCGHPGYAAQKSYELNSLSEVEKAAGFDLVFDGKQIDPALLVDQGGGVTQWVVDTAESALKPIDIGKDICTNKKYANFELRIEWKGGDDKQNSGIFVRSPQHGQPAWKYGAPEFAIQAGPQSGNCQSNGNVYPCFSGDNYDMQYAQIHNYKDREYNSAVLFFNGNFVEFWMNDEKVNEFEMYSAKWTGQYNNSAWPNKVLSGYNYGGDPKGGYVCMQDHGHEMSNALWFRNFKIREFEKDGQLPPPLVLAGDTAITGPGAFMFDDSVAVDMQVAVTGALIRYTLDGSEPDISSSAYEGPIVLEASCTIKAKSFRARFSPGQTVTREFMKKPAAVKYVSEGPRRVEIINGGPGKLILKATGPGMTGIVLYNVRGGVLVSRPLPSGLHTYKLPGPAVYFLKINHPSGGMVKKLMVY